MRLAAALALLVVQSPSALAAPVARTGHDAALGDLTISCDAGPMLADYRAETASGVALTSAYARERDADKGLVRRMDQGGRRVRRYIVPHADIRALVRVRSGGDMPDHADLIFTRKGGLTLVHTSTANGGVFTYSEVYRLALKPDGGTDRRALKLDQDLSHSLDLGLAAYQPRSGRCT